MSTPLRPGSNLGPVGWDDRAAVALEGLQGDPGRVVRVDRGVARIVADAGPVDVLLPPTLRLAVGDWVALREGPAVAGIAERWSLLARQAAGRETVLQPLAANVDVVFVTAAGDTEINQRRLERTLAVAWAAGAQPVVVLTKADTVFDVAATVATIRAVAVGVDVLVTSARDDRGLDDVRAWTQPADGLVPTVVLLGPSGAGKSTLVNAIAGREVMSTGDVRDFDNVGRHTTTHRELVSLPTGGVLIDTPGLREVQLWDTEGLDEVFADIAELAGQCRFSDCSHAGEPGCAVAEAVAEGNLDPARLESWRDLNREAAAAIVRRDKRAAAEQRRQSKPLHKELRRLYRERGER